MADIIKEKYIVLKNEDIEKYCKVGDLNALDFIRHRIRAGRENEGKPTNNSYYVCNTDEPYADEVLHVILNGEDGKQCNKKDCIETECEFYEPMSDSHFCRCHVNQKCPYGCSLN